MLVTALVVIIVLEFCAIWWMAFRPGTYQGTLTVYKYEDGRLTYSLEVNENPDGFQHMDEICLKVVTGESAE